MPDLARQQLAQDADPLVVKVGTRVVTREDGQLDRPRIAALAEELNGLIEAGRKVVLVSSGAVGAGMSHLDIRERPQDLAKLQAVAAIGQTKLKLATAKEQERYDKIDEARHTIPRFDCCEKCQRIQAGT